MNSRQRAILDVLATNSFASPDGLAAILGVSAITVRRELIRMERRELLRRVHGGAIPVQNETAITHVAARLHQNAQAKRAIAAFAAQLIRRGDTFFLDAGSTCYYLAKCMPENLDLTVVTHSLDNVNMLRQKMGVHILCTGGELNERLNAFVGPLAEGQVKQFRPDKAFIASAGIDPEQGCTNNAIIERNIKTTMNARARDSYILADASKLGILAFHQSIALKDIKTVITNRNAALSVVRRLRKAGIRVLLA